MLQVLLALGALCAVLGTGLHTAGHTLGIQRTTNDVVTDAGQVLDTAAADHDHRVLLQVVALTRDVSSNFDTVSQTYTSYFTKSRVRLFRGCSINPLSLIHI